MKNTDLMGDMFGGMIGDILKNRKFRKDCKYCVSAAGSPIEMSFCSFGMKPREVTIIITCDKDCVNFCEDVKVISNDP